MLKAIFLDRDGTIIEDRGHLHDPAEVVFLPGAVDALRLLQHEFLLFIVTNQSGIAKNVITRQDADRVNAHVVTRLREAGVQITDVYLCPHTRQDGCSCIKPRPHFLLEAAKQYGIDLNASFTVGDHPHDVELARAVGARGVYVLTGHGRNHLAELPPGELVASDIGEAAQYILTCHERRTNSGRATDELRQAAHVLQRGGIVAFPTETVYGLGASAFNPEAVARIFEVKQRPRFDPLIVHVHSMTQAMRVVRQWPAAAVELARRFWPGPLTLVLPKSELVPDIVTSGLPTVGLRMPDHPLALALIAEAGLPVAAPSANRFGSISPTRAEHVRKQLGDAVDMVLDGGPCRVGIESTIVSLAEEAPILLRAGGIAVEDIEGVIGPVSRQSAFPDRPTSPGQCLRHYAPRTPLILCESTADPPVLPRAGLLTVERPSAAGHFEAVEVLSASGDLREAATNLFAALHRLDAMGLDVVVAVKAPGAGLGLAINDRLQRAAHRPTPEEVEWSSL